MRSEPYFYMFGLPMGPPQFAAAFLLLCFLGQCAWLAYTTPAAARSEIAPRAGSIPDIPRDPLVRLAVEVPIGVGHLIGLPWRDLLWLARLPFITLGVLLGASIWYVARRLYGNIGGMGALVLYCFSPMPFVVTQVGPIPIAALGMFGVVFISIAVSHTLYAPPRGGFGGEIRHRWRRVTTLGFAIALMVGAAPELSFMVLVALGMMFYLVPHRRREALGLMVAALAIAAPILLLLAGPRWFAQAGFSPLAGWSAPRYVVHTSVASTSIVLTVIAASAAAVYLSSRRSRYFGNSAPLLATALTLVLGLPSLGHAYLGAFPAWSLPLLFVFVGGIFADLAETPWRRAALLVFVVLASSLATLELLAVGQHQWTSGGRELSPPAGVRRIRI
ncbi:MAG: hypothetical protein LAN37_11865 [Acidobacteriia bacterium]|nr:hypothetical protein [Terriglobia bacterium]